MDMQFPMFEKEVYIRRRKVLQERMDSGIVLLLGNEESGMNYADNCYPFRQDSTFLYYFGLKVPGIAAILDLDSGEAYIFGDELTIDHIVWTGDLPAISDMASSAGVHHTRPYQEIEAYISKAKHQGRQIHYIPPYRPENCIKLSGWLNIPITALKGQASVSLIKAIVSQRSIKEPCELAEMDKATIISADMHLAAIKYAAAGMKEYEIIAKVKEVAHSNNASPSFNPIVTVHGEILHNLYNGNTLKKGQMVLCDAGAANEMEYAGDLTITFPVSEAFSDKQKAVYEIVLAAQESSVAMLRPGILYLDVYHNAAMKIVEGMKSLGLMKGDPAEAVAAGAHALFFQCGLGHMIGLDVHDMEDLGEEYVGYTDTLKKSTQFGRKSLRLARALEPGFTLTVEPGVYMIPQLMDQWRAEQKFKDFIHYDALSAYRDFTGIRIEEDYVITAHGCRLLGKRLPKTVAEVESYRIGL